VRDLLGREEKRYEASFLFSYKRKTLNQFLKKKKNNNSDLNEDMQSQNFAKIFSNFETSQMKLKNFQNLLELELTKRASNTLLLGQ
jgi:hypothetical protein